MNLLKRPSIRDIKCALSLCTIPPHIPQPTFRVHSSQCLYRQRSRDLHISHTQILQARVKRPLSQPSAILRHHAKYSASDEKKPSLHVEHNLPMQVEKSVVDIEPTSETPKVPLRKKARRLLKKASKKARAKENKARRIKKYGGKIDAMLEKEPDLTSKEAYKRLQMDIMADKLKKKASKVELENRNQLIEKQVARLGKWYGVPIKQAMLRNPNLSFDQAWKRVHRVKSNHVLWDWGPRIGKMIIKVLANEDGRVKNAVEAYHRRFRPWLPFQVVWDKYIEIGAKRPRLEKVKVLCRAYSSFLLSPTNIYSSEAILEVKKLRKDNPRLSSNAAFRRYIAMDDARITQMARDNQLGGNDNLAEKQHNQLRENIKVEDLTPKTELSTIDLTMISSLHSNGITKDRVTSKSQVIRQESNTSKDSRKQTELSTENIKSNLTPVSEQSQGPFIKYQAPYIKVEIHTPHHLQSPAHLIKPDPYAGQMETPKPEKKKDKKPRRPWIYSTPFSSIVDPQAAEENIKDQPFIRKVYIATTGPLKPVELTPEYFAKKRNEAISDLSRARAKSESGSGLKLKGRDGFSWANRGSKRSHEEKVFQRELRTIPMKQENTGKEPGRE